MKFEKKVFYSVGVFIFIGWIASMLFHSEMYTVQELTESIFFIFACILVYFIILYFSYKEKRSDKTIYIILGGIFFFSCIGLFFTI